MQIRTRNKGIAIATALMLMVLLLVLGLSLLSSSQRDLNFQRRQALADRAATLAQSGVEYYIYLRSQTPSAAPTPSGQVTIPVATGEAIVLENVGTPLGTFTSTAQIANSDGDVIFERTIVVPGGLRDNSYDRELQ